MSGLEYILGLPIDRFPDNQLPTIKDVLRFYSINWGKRISDSKKEEYVAKELIKVYQEAGLPVINEKSIKDRIKKHVVELKTVLKFKSKVKTAANIQTEVSFRSKLDETFRIQSSATCQMSANQRATIHENVDEIASEIHSDDDSEIFNDQSIGRASADPDFEDPDVRKQPISDEHLWKMFGTGVSFRALSTVLDSAFTSANAQNQFCTSTPYLYSNYKRLLQVKENEYQIRIREDKSFGTICFDHQNMRKIAGKYEGTTHRLAIVWHCKKTHNVIGIEEMLDKTAESQAQAIQRVCEKFSIKKEQIIALTCDNENTNTGIRGGTCVLLEIALNKSLLRTMCRRHIMEIVIKDVYYHLFDSDTPNNIFYNILKEIWSDLRRDDFPFEEFNEYSFTGDMNLETHAAFEQLKNKAITELISHSKSKLVRDDYREVTLVALKFFGHYQNPSKANEVKFRTIINPSMARFMAVAIQGLECYLFRRSIDWNLPDRKGLKYKIMRFATFVALIYIRYWNRSSNLFDAPINDLCFLRELQVYQMFDEPVANVAISAFGRHLNYMSEELTPLCLFSEKVSIEEKNEISEKMRASFDDIIPIRNGSHESNHIALYNDDVEYYDWERLSLSDLIGDRSQFFFQSMNLPLGFLNMNANEWKRNKDYKNAKKIVENSLVCINDASERVISNCKSKFNKQRCKKETTFRQNILSLHLN